MLFPVPQQENILKLHKLEGIPSVFSECSDAGYIKEFFSSNRIGFSENAVIRINTEKDCGKDMCYIEESRTVTNEKYTLFCECENEKINITVRYAHKHGLFYAFNTILQQIESGFMTIGETVDYPLFRKRGFIEGFYGKPWTTAEREDMLRLMARHKMNTFYYGPKDDPYHREKWRELYPAEELSNLKNLIDLSKDLFIDFNFCIAPGLSMTYCDEDDFEVLLNKIKQLYDCGVRSFGLLLDDIPEKLSNKRDADVFGNESVNAHIYIANKLFDSLQALDKNINLTLCPRQYHGNGDEYFISKFGQNLEAQIDLFWTGHNICSQELTVMEAVKFITSTRHKPLYWDNFPVNDAEMYNEMHLGYITGRENELYKYSNGLISNCMEYCEATKIPLLTVAAYLWNPLKYDAEAAWEYAQKAVVGNEKYDLFKYFSDCLLFSCLKIENTPILNGVLGDAEQNVRDGKLIEAFSGLAEYVENVQKCCEMIEKSKDIKLFNELSRWYDKFVIHREVLENCLLLIQENNEAQKQKVQQLLNTYMRLPEPMADFAFQATAEFFLEL